MRMRLLWGVMGAVMLGLIAAIVYIQLAGGVGTVLDHQRSEVAIASTLPFAEAKDAVIRSPGAAASPALPSGGTVGFEFYLAVAIAFLFSAIVAFIVVLLGLRKLTRDVEELLKQIKKINENQGLGLPKAVAVGDGGRSTGFGAVSARADLGLTTPPVSRSGPTGSAIDGVDSYPASYPLSTEQPLNAPTAAVQPSVDPAELQHQAEMVRRQQANEVLEKFHAQFQQFLAGPNVSQKAYDVFVGEYGRPLMVQSIDGEVVHFSQDATGTEKLLALQLTGHEPMILLPSFYFISDFSSSFARMRDVPREIRAGYEIIGGGNGQLQINRLGVLCKMGEAWTIAEPRGKLSGFID